MTGIDYSGKVAVVTGGAQGIGAATAELLSTLGARIAVLDRDEKHGRALVEKLNNAGATASYHACDVSRMESVRSTVQDAAQRHGAIHLLVCSAGIQRYGDALSTDDETWHETMRVHVDGCFYAARACLPHLIAAGEGSIVIVGSVQSVTAVANSAAYVTEIGRAHV